MDQTMILILNTCTKNDSDQIILSAKKIKDGWIKHIKSEEEKTFMGFKSKSI